MRRNLATQKFLVQRGISREISNSMYFSKIKTTQVVSGVAMGGVWGLQPPLH